MGLLNSLVVFSLDERSFALHLSVVERVHRVVEVTPLPKAPQIVLGVINVQGRIIPVFDVRGRFGLPARSIRLSDQLLVANTSRRAVALLVDSVQGVRERLPEETVGADEILPSVEYVEGVVKLKDGMVFIHNLDTFLSLHEELALEAAMSPSAQEIPDDQPIEES